jgi:tripartite-type tricarboxylate transporter receptor subunit TctC
MALARSNLNWPNNWFTSNAFLGIDARVNRQERKQPMLSSLKFLVTLALYCILALQVVWADSYPSKPIRIIVPYEPGGGVDIMARLLGRNLSQVANQNVIIENRPGGGGVVGTQALVSANPDGYSLMLGSTSPVVIAPFLVKKLSYNPSKDLQPVCLIAINPAILLVNNNSKFNTLKDIIAEAKAHPGALTFSSSGIGGTSHLAASLLKVMADVEMQHVAYKGTGPATLAVLSGEVDITFADLIAGIKFIKNGQLKPIAITSKERMPILDSLPAVSETIPDYAAGVWTGIFAPAKTPPEIIAQLNKLVNKTIKSPEMMKSLNGDGVSPIGGTPQEFAKLISEESDRWGDVLRKSGIAAE